ncbi:Glycosyl transferases group 1 [Halopseudomonas xinjiangensis]|uniref:Glycosyl transferases group 1 n=1 Tax=Halopseudomonas xinjiangensis TaxID=487184 RepID=A0A1H1M0A0_9GAMM|nr:glycosyltransferase [Halopseudomonas xinjiangensis]SDR80236.1 Glycosyl transferases group 1 [Halopseudomonas xinjiangensis]
MNILWLTQSYEVHAFDRLAESLGAFASVTLSPLDAAQQADLSETLATYDFSTYDRVMTTLRTKKEMKQWKVMRDIPNLVIFEYDACQNYIVQSKYRGRFSTYFRRLAHPRIIVSGATVANKFRREGFDVHFLPKGYDASVIHDHGMERNIPLGFIGKVHSDVYRQRGELLEELSRRHELQLLRTAPGLDYARTLARIEIFVSADIGLGEYMAKNFEAMGAGCLLMAYDHGIEETRALGFEDMKNVVLFKDADEFAAKLETLRARPEAIRTIARNGQLLAESRFAFQRMGERLYDILAQPLMPRSDRLSWRDRWFG